jgi:uncharacterized membrane protein YdjX (TVP38/TMEM64 family)
VKIGHVFGMTRQTKHALGNRSSAAMRRWLPLALFLAAILAVYASGLPNYLSFAAIAEHRELLKDFVARNPVLSVAIYMLVYFATVAFSVPGALLLSILGGFLFGWVVSAPATIVAATLGAIVVFKIVGTSLGSAIAERASPFLERLRSGFGRDAFSYLLFLRLVPLFPFFAVNAVAGLLNIPLSTFILATGLGIIPASFIFAYLGSGFDAVIDGEMQRWRDCAAGGGGASCKLEFDPASLLTSQMIAALLLLAALALVPIVIRRFTRKPP